MVILSVKTSDPTNWWIPNRACAEAPLRSSGFIILDQPEEEVLLCKRQELVERGGESSLRPSGLNSRSS
jgi:hypothetical protein